MPVKRRRTRKHRKRRRTRRLRGGTPAIVFYSNWHYGDNLFNLKFIYDISAKLKEKGTKIRYFYDSNYIKNVDELKRYIDPDVLTLETGSKPEGAIELWMGNPIENKCMVHIKEGTPIVSTEEFFDLFYKKMLKDMGLEGLDVNTSLFQEEPYLDKLYENFDPKFKDLDILIINAEPMSGQVAYNKDKFNAMCVQLASKYKVATTSPIEGHDSIPCTMRDKLMLQDIGAVSTHATRIIATHSGPLTPCFNAQAKRHVKKWIIFADNGAFHSEINALICKEGYDLSKIEDDLN
jgi:hypothetical protein